MKSRLLIIFILTIFTLSTRGGDFGTLLYHTKIELLNRKVIDGYFTTYSDYPEPIKFKTERELRAFVVQRTIYTTDVLEGIYQRAYKILDYQCVEEWIRGHTVLLNDIDFAIREKDILTIQLVSVTRVNRISIDGLTERLVSLLVKEPNDMVTLNLDSKLTAIGDIDLSFLLISYNQSNNVDLRKIKAEIEKKYFSESASCNQMNVFQAWTPIYREYKEKLEKENIYFIKLTSF
ncbi:MAG: hypothetical protein ACKO96_09540 [Flammeovirgaceae bacterium]